MKIVIASRQRSKKINARMLKRIANGLLAELNVAEVELGINLVGTREMTLVNETFLQHQGSTDVITFDHSPAKSRTPGADIQIHGELFICVDDAIRQANEFRTTWQSEVVRYVIHGVLHLLGFDDSRPQQRRKMKLAENRWLRLLAGRFSLAQIGGTPKISA